MKIEVLGTGCDKCNKLYAATQEAVSQCGVDVELCKVETLDELMRHGVMLPPGLVIGGTLKSQGKLPKPAQIAAWIDEAAQRGPTQR
jgi:small redox-active disulfide protein 2